MSQPLDDSARAGIDQLVEIAQAGDEEAFTTLFNYYRAGISGYLAGLLKHVEDRDDLAQETFLKAWKNLSQLQEVSRFKPWLYRIATNLVNDYMRSRGNSGWLSLEDCDELEGPAHFEDYVGEEEHVKLALEAVPWKYRKCLLLQIEGRLSKSEIAEATNINIGSVSTYVSYGRQHFRQAYHCLENERTAERER